MPRVRESVTTERPAAVGRVLGYQSLTEFSDGWFAVSEELMTLGESREDARWNAKECAMPRRSVVAKVVVMEVMEPRG